MNKESKMNGIIEKKTWQKMCCHCLFNLPCTMFTMLSIIIIISLDMSLNHCITKSLIELCSHQAISQPSFIYRYSSEAEYNEEERWLGSSPAADLEHGDLWSVHHPVAGLGLYPAVPRPANQSWGTVCQPCQPPTHPALHLQSAWNWEDSYSNRIT